MLKIKEILQRYPKSAKSLKMWMKEMLQAFQKQWIEEGVKDLNINKGLDIPEVTEEMIVATLDGMVSVNFRMLYDFFDKNNVVLCIQYDFQHGLFTFSSNLDTKSHNTRIEAEIIGFEKAFETLESKL